MKKAYFLIALSLFILVASRYWLVAVSAQESSSSADVDQQVTESLKKRLEKAAKDETGSVLGETTKKAYVGTLESMDHSTLTIKTNGGNHQAEIGDKTKIIGKDKQALKTDDLEIGSFLIVMGYTTDKDVLDARRVVVSDKPPAPTYQAYQVKIQSMKKDTLSVASVENSSSTWQVKITKDTTVTQTYEGNQADITIGDLKTSDTLIVLAKTDDKAKETLIAAAIHLPSGRAIISQSPEASASTKPKSSSTPKPTPTPSPAE